MLRRALVLALSVALALPALAGDPDCPEERVESGAARLLRLHRQVAQGRVPAQPRWLPYVPRSREGTPMCGLPRPFASRTIPLQSRVSLFPLAVADPDRWAPLQERALLGAACSCDLSSLPGRLEDAPLRVGKVPPGDLSLTWTSSCSPGASDYAVYQGTLGSFASHQSATCSSAGSTAWTLTPHSGNRYYLVVPLTDTEEGSYGTRSDGGERFPAAAPCRPTQRTAACP